MGNNELLAKCFSYINSFKRHRALAHINRIEGDQAKANFHELKQYQFLDSLELGLRAMQKGVRCVEEIESEERV